MYVLINLDEMRFVSTGNYWALCDQAQADFPDAAYLVGPAKDSCTYTDFTETELRLLYKNTTGNDSAGINKWELPKQVMELVSSVPPCNKQIPLPIPEPYSPKPTAETAPVVSQIRPKAGTTTGRVWELADWLLANRTEFDFDSKEFRNQLIADCVYNGINASTAQVQYSKWKKHH